METVIGRGRGKGWLKSVKPQSCPVKPTDIDPLLTKLSFDSDKQLTKDDYDETKHSVDELSDLIAADILNDEQTTVHQEESQESIFTDLHQNRKDKLNTITLQQHIDEKPKTSFNSVLQNAVNAPEFVPKFAIPADERSSIEPEYTSLADELAPSSYIVNLEEQHFALHVLNDVMVTLLDDPGDFDSAIMQLCEHLKHFLTQEETIHEIVNFLVDQGKADPSFNFIVAKVCHKLDETKSLELENGVGFRKVFFSRCQNEFLAVEKKLNKTTDADIVADELLNISNLALFFGELFCNMKLKGEVNPIFKTVVLKFIKMFLRSGKSELIVSVTRLLKLVGPELDVGKPKDVDEVFIQVRDFCFDKERTKHLAESVRLSLLRVYKMHTRDWDRSPSNPPSPAFTHDSQEFSFPEVGQSYKQNVHMQGISEDTAGPPNWNDYYDGDDTQINIDFYPQYFDQGEEYDEEYENFLRESGQL